MLCIYAVNTTATPSLTTACIPEQTPILSPSCTAQGTHASSIICVAHHFSLMNSYKPHFPFLYWTFQESTTMHQSYISLFFVCRYDIYWNYNDDKHSNCVRYSNPNQRFEFRYITVTMCTKLEMYTVPMDSMSLCLRANYMFEHAKVQYTSCFCESCSPSWLGSCSIHSPCVGCNTGKHIAQSIFVFWPHSKNSSMNFIPIEYDLHPNMFHIPMVWIQQVEISYSL